LAQQQNGTDQQPKSSGFFSRLGQRFKNLFTGHGFVTNMELKPVVTTRIIIPTQQSGPRLIPANARVQFNRNPSNSEMWDAAKDCFWSPDPSPKPSNQEQPSGSNDAPEGPSPGMNAAGGGAAMWNDFAHCFDTETNHMWWP
jgi:hypothetical protein